MHAPSPMALLLIAIVVLVLFGRGKVSSLMGEVGKGITAFKRGVRDGADEVERTVDTATDRAAIEGLSADPAGPPVIAWTKADAAGSWRAADDYAARLDRLVGGLEAVGGFGGKAVALAEGALYSGDPGFYKKQLAALAAQGRADQYRFPRPMTDRPGMDFSFSGLKTAVRSRLPPPEDAQARADLAHAFQEAVTDTLTIKCARAIEATGFSRLVVAGGVGANLRLRERLGTWCAEQGVGLYFPRQAFCTDNAAMMAYVGWQRRAEGRAAAEGIFATPRWSLMELAPPCPT